MLKSLKILNIFLLLAFSSGSFWHQSDGVIYKDGLEFIIRGIVWFGNEGPDRAPGGLWSSHLDNSNTVLHSISWFMQKIKDLGFNSLRITLSPQSLSSDDITYPTASWAKNSDPSLTSGLAVLTSMLNEAFNVGLFVVLDYTTCSDSLTGNSQPGDPTMCSGYSLNDWIADLTKLVKLTKKYPNIIGVEILSEPHSISWKTWKLYA
jgi:aryl-phospho-beta-D-glucosidase BglC (GH1 family)